MVRTDLWSDRYLLEIFIVQQNQLVLYLLKKIVGSIALALIGEIEKVEKLFLRYYYFRFARKARDKFIL